MSVVDDVKGRLDLMEVVSGYVALQHSGRNYKANCPFHQERTPSFYVYPDRQSWRCFGACATGGDVFAFVMKAENLEFGEVLRRLAEQAGVTLPTRERREELDVAYRINEAARGFFQQWLAGERGTATREYLVGRGVTGSSIEKFELGLSPPEGQTLLGYLTQQGFSPEQLLYAGIVQENRGGGYRDAFRGRLMIPIRNGSGELGGFGSRALAAEATPKYLNTGRTAVFDKGRTLYGLYLAKERARREGLVIVEGYMDAIMAHQHGYGNVVASMGTALTAAQVAEARRLTHRITMALDADAAGQQATLRSLESSWQIFQQREQGRARNSTPSQRAEDLELRVAVLSGGKDPDEIIRQDPAGWKDVVEESVPLFDYLLPTLGGLVDIGTPQGKARMAQWLRPFIVSVREPIQQDYYYQRLADYLSISPEALRASLGRPAATGRAVSAGARMAEGPGPEGDSVFAAIHRDPLEDYCLTLLLQYPELAEVALEEGNLPEEYFRRAENREIYTRLQQAWAEAPEFPIPRADLLPALRERAPEALEEQLAALAARELPPLEGRGAAADFRRAALKLEERHLKELKRSEQAWLRDDEDAAVAAGAEESVLGVNRKLKDNQRQRKEQARAG